MLQSPLSAFVRAGSFDAPNGTVARPPRAKASGQQQSNPGNGAEKVQIVSGAVRQSPAHSGQKMPPLRDMGEHDDEQTRAAG